MRDKLNQILDQYQSLINTANDLHRLDELFLELFGKSGKITGLPKEFSKLDRSELQMIGPLFNDIKVRLENAIERQREKVREQSYQQLEDEKLNLSEKVEVKSRAGNLHPLTSFKQEIIRIFDNLGFKQFDARHIDTDLENFELLNIPKEHPARDLWDTLYIDDKNLATEEKTLLRTHTSNAQVKLMKKYKDQLPIRMIIFGRCFRYENLDARHEHTFEQFELVYIDKGVSMANLQFLSESFFKQILGEDTIVRMRPKYYPFVEPSAGIDALCIFCKGAGCKICGNGWLELAGAGMIHPTVLKNGGIDPEVYSGIAWGTGLERFLMLKYGIEDIRIFNSGDLRLYDKIKENK